ncbi:hypothetical protein ALC56_09160 [Trachymyrmex septentrionalis]|uniref:Uncharacterized protein n=1 Tax=Trachymyrmex septentrionalis TaxID=34720 RepID=A0A195F6H7_9HYME|nr:hypothetical protein ALC56_09160 [Trachymyrmex septentrionalis]
MDENRKRTYGVARRSSQQQQEEQEDEVEDAEEEEGCGVARVAVPEERESGCHGASAAREGDDEAEEGGGGGDEERDTEGGRGGGCALALVHPLAHAPSARQPPVQALPSRFSRCNPLLHRAVHSGPATPARARFELKRNLKPLPMPAAAAVAATADAAVTTASPPRPPRQHHEMTHNETNEKWEFPDLSSYPRGARLLETRKLPTLYALTVCRGQKVSPPFLTERERIYNTGEYLHKSEIRREGGRGRETGKIKEGRKIRMAKTRTSNPCSTRSFFFEGMSKSVEIFGKRLCSGSRTNNNLNHVALSAVIQSKFNGERIAIADKPVELIIIVLGQLNQSMAYRSRSYFVWKLGPTGTCANKVLGDDDSAILRQPLLVTLTFLITGSRCRRASSTLCALASLDDLTGIEKHGRNERVVELT